MSDISKIKLPSGDIYNIKDTAARTDLSNVYTKTEVNTMIGNLVGVKFGGPYNSVSALPVTGSGDTIYLVDNGSSESNVYDEYLWITDKYELIGSTEVDLSNYALVSQIPTTTSQLTNNSGFITSSDLPGLADANNNGLMSSTQYSRVAQLTDTYINNLIDAKIDAAIAGGY